MFWTFLDRALFFQLKVVDLIPLGTKYLYRTGAIITCSCFETAFNYKPRILDPKIEEFPCLQHKLYVTLTAVKNGVRNIQTAGYNGMRTAYTI